MQVRHSSGRCRSMHNRPKVNRLEYSGNCTLRCLSTKCSSLCIWTKICCNFILSQNMQRSSWVRPDEGFFLVGGFLFDIVIHSTISWSIGAKRFPIYSACEAILQGGLRPSLSGLNLAVANIQTWSRCWLGCLVSLYCTWRTEPISFWHFTQWWTEAFQMIGTIRTTFVTQKHIILFSIFATTLIASRVIIINLYNVFCLQHSRLSLQPCHFWEVDEYLMLEKYCGA